MVLLYCCRGDESTEAMPPLRGWKLGLGMLFYKHATPTELKENPVENREEPKIPASARRCHIVNPKRGSDYSGWLAVERPL